MTFTADDFLTIEVFEQLNREFAEVAGRRGATGVVQLNLVQGFATVPDAAFINRIERNIDQIAARAPHIRIAQTKVWQGGANDRVRLNFNDANRWFASLASLR